MNWLKYQIAKEKRLIKLLPETTLTEVNSLLDELFDRTIRWTNHDNSLRLLGLRMWMERYKVDLCYVLQSIVPYHLEHISKQHKNNPHALGFKVSTLVGKKSEHLLRENIERDYPQGENISTWFWDRQQEIIKLRTEDEFTAESTKKITDYKSVSKFITAYRKRVTGKQKTFQKEMNRATNTRRPYRTNPWI